MKLLKSHRCFHGFTEFYEHDSSTTKTSMKFSVYRPESSKSIKGALIWLSGLTCNEENFITKSGAQRVLSERGLVVICPDTSPRGLMLPGEHEAYDFGSGAGFYVDATTSAYKENYNMASYVNEELYALMDIKYELRGRMGLFGHSMGGHGALTLALKNPQKYRSVSAFSPIVNPMNCEWGRKAFTGYLGRDEESWKDYDSCELLKSGKRHPSKILIDQGLADDFYPAQLLTKNFEILSSELGQASLVNYREGYDHSYYFISTFVESHLKHHLSYF